MNEIKANPGRIVVLGRRKENQARCVTFNIAEWRDLYGEGTVQLLAQRTQDEAPYPCAVTEENGIVRWVIREADVAVPGEGKAELQYHIGETVAVSDTYRTWVLPSLGAPGAEPPAPEQDWVETVLQAARDAAQSAQDAKDAVTQTISIGENGNWFIDGEDTGVSASGPRGEQGKQGEPGESGVYCGVEEPTDGANVWIDPTGKPNLPDSGGNIIRIDLAEYDLDVFTLFLQGGGDADFPRAPEVFALAEANPDADINFVIRYGDYIYVETKATKVGTSASRLACLSAHVPLYYEGLSDLEGAYVLGLVIVGDDNGGAALLSIEKMDSDSGSTSAGGLPVVEISGIATAEGTPLTEAENALTSELINQGMPFVLKCCIELEGVIINLGGVATVVSSDSAVLEKMAVVQFSGLGIIIMNGVIVLQEVSM